MTIPFSQVPTTLRIPLVAVEFNSSQAQQGPAILPYSALLIGQKLSGGTWTADTVNQATSIDAVITGAGRGSMLHREAIGWFATSPGVDLWCAVLSDNGAGVAATGTILFTAAATGAGTIAFYLGGIRVPVAVAGTEATTALATNTAAAINANTDLPVTASVSGSTVTILFRHKGEVGNVYDVRTNYNAGEVLPAGVAMTITAMGSVVAGTTNPTLTNVIAAMGDQWWEIWAHPYTDATSLTAIEAELLSRFGSMRAIDGVAITSKSGTFSAITTLGLARNSGQSVIIAQPGDAPLTPPMEFAAETAALVAASAQNDPAKPLQTLAMKNALPPSTGHIWTNAEQDLFLHEGIAQSKVGPGGVVQLGRVITTYQKNAAGSADTAYLDATTPLNLLYLRSDFRSRFTKFARHKLAADGTRFGSGQEVMTPDLGTAIALAWFRDNETAGRVQNYPLFKANLKVEINASNPNRLDFLLPPTLMGQLIVVGASFQFRL